MVLYGQTERGSIGAWYILRQLGMTNCMVLQGGFDCFNEPDKACSSERPEFDFAEIASSGGIKEVEIRKEVAAYEKIAPVESTPEEKKEIKVEKKVKMEAEGGC